MAPTKVVIAEMLCGMRMTTRSPEATPFLRRMKAWRRARPRNSENVTVSHSSSSIHAVTKGRSQGAAARASMRLRNGVTLPDIVTGARGEFRDAGHQLGAIDVRQYLCHTTTNTQ